MTMQLYSLFPGIHITVMHACLFLIFMKEITFGMTFELNYYGIFLYFVVYICCKCTYLLFFIGVVSALVGLLAQKGEVKYDEGLITADQIVSHIDDMGFECEVLGNGDESSEIEFVVRINL